MQIKKWNASTSQWEVEYPEVGVGAIVTSNSPSSTTFLRGDGAWATPVGDIQGITAGTGLTGGGTSGSPTINAVGGTGITANADDLAISSQFSPRTAMELPSSQDLNDLKGNQAGFYYQTANADTPGKNYPENVAGSLIVQKSAGQVTQLYITYQNPPKMYMRTYYTSWSSWVRVFEDNYHPNADKWTTARTLQLSGDVTGSVSWDGSANATLTTTVADDSHNHTIANIDNLQTTLNAKQESFGAVSSNPPANGQVLKWNSSASEWEPANDNNTDTNTRRAIEVDGTQILSSSSTTPLDLKAGSGISISNSGGDVTITSSGVTNNVAGTTFSTAYDPAVGSILQYGAYGWQTLDVGNSGDILNVGSSSYTQWSANTGGWTLIKSGSTTISSGTNVTNVTLSAGIGDTDVIAFELNTGSVTSYTSQVHIVKIENTTSVYGGVLYNAYAYNTSIRTGSIRVYRGLNSTTLSFSYAYNHLNGSTSESADTVYVGSIWKLNGRVGA